MQYTVACCYMTHNHPDVIKAVFENMLELYTSKGIEIYVIDSSTNDETKNVVESFIEKGYANNLYYNHVGSNYTAVMKYEYIMRGNGLQKRYDYIWITKDREFFVGDTLDRIVQAINEGHDLVFATTEEDRAGLVRPRTKEIYTDSAEFFYHYGQLTTNWEGVIKKCTTMIDPIDWDYYVNNYGIGEKCTFNQTITIFARLAEMDKMSIKVVEIKKGERLDCTLASSNWKNEVFSLWINEWIAAVSCLPSIYDPYKMYIVKCQTSLPVLFGSVDSMIEKYQKGILTKEVFDNYRKLWPMISDVPVVYIDMILEDKLNDLLNIIYSEFIKAFGEGKYEDVFAIYASNRVWMGMTVYNNEIISKLDCCFSIFKNEINEHGVSLLFKDIYNPEDLLIRYDSLIS